MDSCLVRIIAKQLTVCYIVSIPSICDLHVKSHSYAFVAAGGIY
jgi:hypothetical protein